MTTGPDVKCLSLDALARRAADLSEFEQRLAHDPDLIALDELYVQPNYLVEVGPSGLGEDLDEYVRKWLSRRDGGLLWLLGDFGTGKTWFSRHFAHTLAKMKIGDGLIALPTPVVVPLRQFTGVDDMLHAVQQVLVEGGVRLAAGRATVDWLIRYNKLIPIFDGADEHPLVLVEAQRLTSIGCHIIVTCRTHYFATVTQVSRALGLADDGRKPIAWITHLGFNEQALAEAIRRRCGDDWKEKQTALTRRPDLWEMVHRPLFLDMVLQALDAPITGRVRTVADVYDGYLSQVLNARWAHHRQGKDVTRLVRTALEKLACMGQETARLTFGSDTILKVAEELQQDARCGLTEVEIQQAMCTGSVLVRNPRDEYEFGHRSIQEYLAASSFKRRGREGARLVCDHVSARDWYEVCWLYAAACGRAEPVLSACLANSSAEEPQPLFLAARAMEAARDFEARRGPELGDSLIALFEKEGLAYRDLEQIYDSIRRMGEAGRNTLKRHIRREDPRIRRRCVLTWFESFGHEAFSQVLPFIDHKRERDRHVRWHAAEVLAEVSDRVDPKAAAKFQLHSHDRDLIIRGNALWARTRRAKLGTVPLFTRRAIERVVDRLKSLVAGEVDLVSDELRSCIADEEGRHHPRAHGALLLGRCVAALGWGEPKRAPIGRMLSDLLKAKIIWRGYVARALGELGWKGALPALCGYLETSQDDEIWLRYAVDAVEELAQPRADHLQAIQKAKERVPEKFSQLRSRLEALAANLRGPGLQH